VHRLAEADPAHVATHLHRALEAVATGSVEILIEELPLVAAARAYRRLEAGATSAKLGLDAPG
jgi:hypothetical protein